MHKQQFEGYFCQSRQRLWGYAYYLSKKFPVKSHVNDLEYDLIGQEGFMFLPDGINFVTDVTDFDEVFTDLDAGKQYHVTIEEVV